jgi:hypothetical protein
VRVESDGPADSTNVLRAVMGAFGVGQPRFSVAWPNQPTMFPVVKVKLRVKGWPLTVPLIDTL